MNNSFRIKPFEVVPNIAAFERIEQTIKIPCNRLLKNYLSGTIETDSDGNDNTGIRTRCSKKAVQPGPWERSP